MIKFFLLKIATSAWFEQKQDHAVVFVANSWYVI